MSFPEISNYFGNSLKITVQDESGRPFRNKPSSPRLVPHTKLISGHDMPLIGIGTGKIPAAKVKDVVLNALNVGYRYIDTAYDYNNESEIGEAINTWIIRNGGDREELFICSKLPVYGNHPEEVEKYLLKSLARLQLTYLDLYSIHVPFGLKYNENGVAPAVTVDGKVELEPVNHQALWEVFHTMIAKGLVRSIGVCNFNEVQLVRLLNFNMNHPDVVQIECNVALQQKKLVATCRTLGIAVTGSCPLGSLNSAEYLGTKFHSRDTKLDLLNNPVVKKIADSNGKTPAQILLRFLVQQSIIPIYDGTNIDKMHENLDVLNFSLSQDEMNELKKLEQGEQARIATFLHYKGIEHHEEYPF